MFPEWLLRSRLRFGWGSMRGSRLIVRVISLGSRASSRIASGLRRGSGYEVAERYVDDDVSAYSGQARPEYERMLDDLRAGAIDAVVVWHLDRLHRQPKELEEFFEVCEEPRRDVLWPRSPARSTWRRTIGQLPRSYPRCGGHAGERRQEPPHPAQARGARASGKPSGGGSRPYGYEADKVTVRPAEAAIVEECAQPLPALASRSLDRARPERARRPDGERWRVVAAASAPDARLAADQRAARAPRRDRRRRRSGRRSSATRTSGRSGRCSPNPERRTNKAARRYLLGGLLVCSHCGERLVARPRRAGSAAMPARRGRASAAAARPTQGRPRRGVRRRGGPAPARHARAAARARAASAPKPDARALAGRRAEAAQAQLDELAAAYGQREITMPGVARRAQADRAAPDRGPQAARQGLTARSVLDGYVGNGDALRDRVGRARPQPAARDRRRRARPRRRRPRPARLQPLRRVRLTPRLAPLSQQLRHLASACGSVTLTGTPWSAQVARPTPARGPLDLQPTAPSRRAAHATPPPSTTARPAPASLPCSREARSITSSAERP